MTVTNLTTPEPKAESARRASFSIGRLLTGQTWFSGIVGRSKWLQSLIYGKIYGNSVANRKRLFFAEPGLTFADNVDRAARTTSSDRAWFWLQIQTRETMNSRPVANLTLSATQKPRLAAKVFLRRKVLSIDQPKKPADQMNDDEDENLPKITCEDFETAKKNKSLDTIALENPSADANPALNGALAIAIFDQAMTLRLLEHVVKYCLEVAPKNVKALWLGIELPLRDVEMSDPVFPGKLSTALAGMGRRQ
ncbi:hypothetical protein FN846DRAFT_921064 [Sphaerosporella brunnea]|uniref:Uncharacterized protein n=1 Tax=Sphaerosporella brunnea TaxID=1250544 RepID=A0A5J5EP01_9PEZI|nr:hypothetical protein FN846DRAFT_921064 [Sphaerosporella brunnea]